MARSQWVGAPFMEHLLAGCMPANREALRLSMDYGIRIGDVLRIKRVDAESGVYSFKEEKTGKRRRVTLSQEHQQVLLSMAGKVYCFEHRTDWRKHRSRQAVYKDLRRIASAFRLKQVTPHSARKIYSVNQYKASGGDLKKVQRLLNHSSEAVTMLYAMADQLSRYSAEGEKK